MKSVTVCQAQSGNRYMRLEYGLSFCCRFIRGSLNTHLFCRVLHFVKFCMPGQLRNSPSDRLWGVACLNSLNAITLLIPVGVIARFRTVQFFVRDLIVELCRLSEGWLGSYGMMTAFCPELILSVKKNGLTEEVF